MNDKNYYLNDRENKKKLWFGSLKDGGCKQICCFLFENNNISTNVKRHKSEIARLKLLEKKQKSIIQEQTQTIKKLTESDIRLKQIEASKSWKMLEKIRNLRK